MHEEEAQVSENVCLRCGLQLQVSAFTDARDFG